MTENVEKPLLNLLATAEHAALGPGPRAGVKSEAELARDLKPILAEASLSTDERELIRALVLLWHDHLDAAHTISQAIENPGGSLVHAIMHRREPDFWNSKYWWRRVGKHPCFPELARRVTALLDSRNESALLAKLAPRGEWDACAFVDACERAGDRDDLLREIQRIEFFVALEHFAGH
ncbi:MAG: hypothetical protein EXS35_16955 [Pedosphaera sp.]|nr:hypothetical protein [Pedosphaera sp.]